MSNVKDVRDVELLPCAAAAIVGVSTQSLRRYEEQGKLNPRRSPGGQRRYLLSEIEALRDAAKEPQLTVDKAALESFIGEDTQDSTGTARPDLSSLFKYPIQAGATPLPNWGDTLRTTEADREAGV